MNRRRRGQRTPGQLYALFFVIWGCAVPRVVDHVRHFPTAPRVIQHADRCAISFSESQRKSQIIIYPYPDLRPLRVNPLGVVIQGECPRKIRAAYLTNNQLGEISPTYWLSPKIRR